MHTQRRGLAFSLYCLLGFLLGLVTAALGPSLGDLAARNHTSIASMGAVYTALFIGALLAQLVAGPLGDRRGRRLVLIGSLVLLAAGVAALCLSNSLSLALAAVVLAGLGHGAADLCILVLAAKAYPEKSVSALNILGLLFGAGAFAGPALVGLSQRLTGSAYPALWTAVAAVALAIPATLFALESDAPAKATGPAKAAEASAAAGGSGGRGALASPYIWILGLLLLVYVGAENGMGGWTAEYFKRTTGAAAPTAALVASGFWLALSAGRLVAAAAGTRLGPRSVLGLGIAVSIGGALLLALTAGHGPATVAAVALVGFGYASIYPTAFAMAAAAFPESPGAATSMVTVLGSAGGMLLPWVEGLVIQGLGAPAAGAFILALGAAMLVLFVLARRAENAQSRAA
ncbi:MAG: MFS transporter [Spirochaetaceae bacterium]|nr:MFS transporter [Spirochaetaceae bacterium]